MIQISFLTLAEADAVELAALLCEHRLLTFDTLEDHVDLLWDDEKPERRHLTHLSGITKALHYSAVERTALELLGARILRIWATPVTSLDPQSARTVMEWTAKV